MSLMKHPSFPERARQNMIEGVPPVIHLIMGVDENVGWRQELRDRPVEPDHFLMPASIGAERFGFDHDQIQVRFFPLVTTGARSKENDLIRIRVSDNRFDDFPDECVGDRPYFCACPPPRLTLSPTRSRKTNTSPHRAESATSTADGCRRSDCEKYGTC